MSDHEPPSARRAAAGPDPHGRGALRLLLAVAVVCGVVAAALLWDVRVGADRARAAHMHQVRATTTADAVRTAGAPWRGAQADAVAAAVWEYPDDVRRSGTVEVPPQTRRGHTVTVWVDESGTPARPPGTTGELILTTFAAGVTVAVVVAGAGLGALYLARRRTALEREWDEVEPVWSGRLRDGGSRGGE
ncbi:hypothetical protein [Streptomyces sp. Da 82-17]|uniref:hypothetical protein n=1 Tax=Streptomyces sp. Da 82-17 TaxID=3377116 RepID=UPI0038D3DC52